ncbi:3-oxoacyl-ACP reductase FabG [Paenibacillus sp. WQ 127069]|uniref:3-oxoacyl-ACP reductase FabG n=1 Tax=Paenibacillus baimaensis TaxID=2982185 RepID=A0ABT2UP61_9BACL|nr:3-oxoacyl-ACP reductase FabG [Paenibacillus sp. WQ 127069]MCU6796439.1 3-oxoacyl-ACP reductase FabG [Paenibacillus sp. WQ 127069]
MQIAVVTGGGRGIGAAITEKLASENFFVILIVNKSLDPARTIVDNIRSNGGQAEIIQCDVSNGHDIKQTMAAIQDQWGTPSILVNNAGVGGPYHAIDQVSEEEWDWIMNTNVKSMFLFSKYVLPQMKEQGYGRIINLSSIFGVWGGANSAVYSTSKHAILGLTKSIAAEWGPYGITCNAISPGYVKTEMGIQEEQVTDHLARVLERSPVKAIVGTKDIADMVNYLAGPSGSMINGASFVIDGGLSAHAGI